MDPDTNCLSRHWRSRCCRVPIVMPKFRPGVSMCMKCDAVFEKFDVTAFAFWTDNDEYSEIVRIMDK